MLVACILILTPGEGRLQSRRVSAAVSSSASADDEGIFVFSVAGHNVGTEKFEIRSSSGKIEAKAEIQLRVERDGKIFNFKIFSDLVLNAQLHPLTYTWSQKGAQVSHLEVDFRASPAKIRYRTVDGEDDNRDFDLPKDVVVLDDNVIHHYQVVARRYLLTAGGKQTFQAFIPQEALPGVLSVEETGLEAVEIRGHMETLRHLVVSTELARIDLWTDDQHRLKRVFIAAAQLEALRKD